MEKSINLVIEDLRDDMLGVIGKYRIPIAITNMVIQEIARSISDATKTAITNDRKIYEEGLKNENSDGK
jgi:uncharacterized protein YejL (UPF0352 family)